MRVGVIFVGIVVTANASDSMARSYGVRTAAALSCGGFRFGMADLASC